MAGMLASKKNRIRHGVDNPIDADGFYSFLSGKRRRKNLRKKEQRQWKRECLTD